MVRILPVFLLAALLVGCVGPLRPAVIAFAVNGCTASPDLDFQVCCDLHDVCYGRGGDEEDRLRCDAEFHQCIEVHDHEELADLYFWGVRLGGGSFFNYRDGAD
jgi:hypothetical protein